MIKYRGIAPQRRFFLYWQPLTQTLVVVLFGHMWYMWGDGSIKGDSE